jgi:hypothetical protein
MLARIGNLNYLFFGPSNIAGPGSCQSPFCLMKIPVLLRLAWVAQRSEALDLFAVGALAQTKTERHRRLA